MFATVFNQHGEGEGFVKVDLEGERGEGGAPYAEVKYEEGTFGGEVIFVPREGEREGGGEREEDDGYLLTFTHSYPRNVSEFRVYDARRMEGGGEEGKEGEREALVASVALPRRVPWGFHALWVEQNELENQRDRVVLRKGKVVEEGGGAARKAKEEL
ncbi:9-cis-epoxycarotenoid dioxygenase [Nannochloropsis gaditana CCMP526]|uniref:9-cis-epoxycarotenoid dioxygenase n=1 Tax=Nannochloropsis gaditana (strain CCMP526) TaxID=1093141 RepID=UPI00029F5773|nr:9-cis-epoxycarotenoid dioxygenase [Nannochloropsis gaditana CCMP526]EKU20397.1 9-cis-epoxycarotenoid dioxygenase [Nannochloropsis gaditana CCMP526]|eukprot:XP_005855954.1 9-cis-epoxycarotenoid dioxygenase [Nannochloropsis gaditana CCMP526]